MSFLWNAVTRAFETLLSSLGLGGSASGQLLVLGLDNAGKTTLLYALQTNGDAVRPFPPTDRPALNEFTAGRVKFNAWDVGGHEAVRHLWQDYVSDRVSAVLFLVDAADTERLEEAAYELDALISERVLAGLPIAVLLNKCDLENAMETSEICERLEWQSLAETQEAHLMRVFRISVLRREGYHQAFRWIGSFLT